MGGDVGITATDAQRALQETAPAPPATAAGSPKRRNLRIGQYELLRLLGSGGMGTVYLARDTKLARLVAIKLLTAPSPKLLKRFLVEARTTARCTHENIVVIHDVDELSGEPYMVLEYLEGAALSQTLAGGAITADRAVEIMVPVLRGLVRAHEFGIVHRDLKPDNIFVTNRGVVKVLDFGIAKLLESEMDALADGDADDVPGVDDGPGLTRDSSIVGTMPYMSPEQWGADVIDHQSDIWAVGVILFEMLAGKHPLAPITRQRLLAAATQLDKPMPALKDAALGAPVELHRIVDRCLRKNKAERYETAEELLAELEPLMPRRNITARADVSPFPGLTAFQEADADRFFGRSDEISRIAARIADQPLVGIVGPSGAGKSSLVRAGVIPKLKSSAKNWESVIVRPGRTPLHALAIALEPYVATGEHTDPDELAQRFRDEPGFLGVTLRNRARRANAHVVLFVDQFEELFTLVDDEDTQAAFLRCIRGAGDDMASPVRVIISIRSDFLDRASAQAEFMDSLTPGLVFLPAPSRAGLRAALVEPVAQVGYRFEQEAIVDDMLEELASTPGALPLLQFAAGRLWDERDSKAKQLTREAYDAIGGIAGALSSHADAVVTSLPTNSQKLVRAIFERLVTPERTRDVVEIEELCELGSGDAIRRLVQQLVDARLLAVHSADDEALTAVEIVHESMIDRWPTLHRWLDDNQEDSAFVARIRTAAKQWQAAGNPSGLLWRGEAMEEVRNWHRRFTGTLAPRETQYLDAVFALAQRSTRVRRWAIAGSMAFLAALVVAGAIALVLIGRAETTAKKQAKAAKLSAKQANDQAKIATEQADKAKREEARAKRAEATSKKQLLEIQAKETELKETLQKVTAAKTEVAKKTTELASRGTLLKRALVKQKEVSEKAKREAEKAKRAEALAKAEKLAKQKLLEKETERANRVEKRRGTISRELKK